MVSNGKSARRYLHGMKTTTVILNVELINKHPGARFTNAHTSEKDLCIRIQFRVKKRNENNNGNLNSYLPHLHHAAKMSRRWYVRIKISIQTYTPYRLLVERLHTFTQFFCLSYSSYSSFYHWFGLVCFVWNNTYTFNPIKWTGKTERNIHNSSLTYSHSPSNNGFKW